eukprot:11973_2
MSCNAGRVGTRVVEGGGKERTRECVAACKGKGQTEAWRGMLMHTAEDSAKISPLRFANIDARRNLKASDVGPSRSGHTTTKALRLP